MLRATGHARVITAYSSAFKLFLEQIAHAQYLNISRIIEIAMDARTSPVKMSNIV